MTEANTDNVATIALAHEIRDPDQPINLKGPGRLPQVTPQLIGAWVVTPKSVLTP